MSLTVEQINHLEEFLLNNQPKKRPVLSHENFENGLEIYKTLLNKPTKTRIIFGSESGGYMCYALYKSQNGKIYGLSAWMNELQSYYIIENEKWFIE